MDLRHPASGVLDRFHGVTLFFQRRIEGVDCLRFGLHAHPTMVINSSDCRRRVPKNPLGEACGEALLSYNSGKGMPE